MASSFMLFLAALVVSVLANKDIPSTVALASDTSPDVMPLSAGEGEGEGDGEGEADETAAVEANDEGADDEVDEEEDDAPEEMLAPPTIPVDKSLRRSLASVGKEVVDAQRELTRARRRCSSVGKGVAREICEEDNKRLSSRLARLLSAEDQLQKKAKNSTAMDNKTQTDAEAVAKLESDLGRLRARARVAKLNGDEAQKEAKRLDRVAREYKRRANVTKADAIKVRDSLEDAEEDEAEAQGAEIAYVAAARAVERGVESPDLAARETLARSVRRELAAEAFYKRSREVRRKAGNVLSNSRENAGDDVNVTAGEVASVMQPPTKVVLHGQSISGLNHFGKSSDFGGRLPSTMTDAEAAEAADKSAASKATEEEETDDENAEEEADEDRADEEQEEEEATKEEKTTETTTTTVAPKEEDTEDATTTVPNNKPVEIDEGSPLSTFANDEKN